MKTITYAKQHEVEQTELLKGLLRKLPPFITNYFNGYDTNMSINTKVGYARNFVSFFEYLRQDNPMYENYELRQFTTEDLEKLTAEDIDAYKIYLKSYQGNSGEIWNNENSGIARKLSALRSLYAYLVQREMIRYNPTAVVKMPKIPEKTIIRLEPDEVALLLDYIENGNGVPMSRQKEAFRKKNKIRDLAICTLLLGTGIRVSECVGLDIDDVNFNKDCISITRKGGKRGEVFFGDEVREALQDYIEIVRPSINPLPGHENALFFSAQCKRISVRTIQVLVDGYSKEAISRHISPHKFRSTYGSSLYQETGDIYVVAEILGHNDVNTTKRHYAATSEVIQRNAARKICLREK